MKISKLFHWLYAFLMLLPVFAIAVKCGYVIFNDNSNESYRGDYKFLSWVPIPTSEQDYYSHVTLDNVILGGGSSNNYYTDVSSWNGSFNIVIPKEVVLRNSANFTIVCLTNIANLTINGASFDYNVITIGYSDVNSMLGCQLCCYNLTDFNFGGVHGNGIIIDRTPGLVVNVYNDGVNLTFDKLDYSFNLLSYTTGFALPLSLTRVDLVNYISRLNYYVDNTLSAVFYSSLQELDGVEFFSWAKDSFLSAPLMYIGALFGITNPHPIFTLMSYWLAVSIIWLVFDLVMYVPLLIHRWLDKGVIE